MGVSLLISIVMKLFNRSSRPWVVQTCANGWVGSMGGCRNCKSSIRMYNFTGGRGEPYVSSELRRVMKGVFIRTLVYYVNYFRSIRLSVKTYIHILLNSLVMSGMFNTSTDCYLFFGIYYDQK